MPVDLKAGDIKGVGDALRRHNWLADGESVTAAGPAGDGNMNLTLRVVLVRSGDGATRSVILKQSRGYVEKYPSIPAPVERVDAEYGFFNELEELPESADRLRIRRLLPTVRGFDKAERLLLLEDLGVASDLTDLYAGGGFETGELEALGGWLGCLHATTRGRTAAGLRDNGAMRELNAEHLFEVPLDGVARFGMNLDDLAPGLTAAADGLRRAAGVRDAFRRAKHVYLASAEASAVLLHGDFYPGSWLRTERGVKVIDPEFCFHGAAVVDVGIAVGHLVLAGRPASEAEAFLAAYGGELHGGLLTDFAGVEVIRRLIGVAQLPLGPETPRIAMLERARATLSAGSGWRGLFA